MQAAVVSLPAPLDETSYLTLAGDGTHGDEIKSWDGLWFAMTSFLLGFDDIKRNAHMNITVWGYSKYDWLDEFDPKYLHLGRAKGNYIKQDGLFMREFEDGWVGGCEPNS